MDWDSGDFWMLFQVKFSISDSDLDGFLMFQGRPSFGESKLGPANHVTQSPKIRESNNI